MILSTTTVDARLHYMTLRYTKHQFSSKSALSYDTTHRLSDSVRLSTDVSYALSTSGHRSPLLSSRGNVGVLSTLAGVTELVALEPSACCTTEFDRCTFAAPRTVDGDVVGHFRSSATWHCTA